MAPNTLRKFFIAASLLLCIGVQAQPTQARWQFLVPNQYHGDEAPAEPGTGWLALTAVGGIWRLEPTVVRATRVFDAVVDAEDQKTGIQISSSHGEALGLLRLPGIKAGKVHTPNMKFKDSPRMLSTTKAPLQISFGKEKYVIEATDSGVFLQKGQQKTRLSGLSAGGADSEDAVSLLWAGDLDRDGGLDLVFAYSGHNNSGVCLYLSAGADKGALVQQAACHGGVGC